MNKDCVSDTFGSLLLDKIKAVEAMVFNDELWRSKGRNLQFVAIW